jgi:hypothetical protein
MKTTCLSGPSVTGETVVWNSQGCRKLQRVSLIGPLHLKSRGANLTAEETSLSWDIFAQDLPAGISALGDIPEDFVPKTLGQRADLIARMLEVVPGADFADPSCGRIRAIDCEVEVSLGDDEDVHSIAFHVYSGKLAPGVVVAILKALKLRALDSATGEIFNDAEAADSFTKWQRYRDKVVRLPDNS